MKRRSIFRAVTVLSCATVAACGGSSGGYNACYSAPSSGLASAQSLSAEGLASPTLVAAGGYSSSSSNTESVVKLFLHAYPVVDETNPEENWMCSGSFTLMPGGLSHGFTLSGWDPVEKTWPIEVPNGQYEILTDISCGCVSPGLCDDGNPFIPRVQADGITNGDDGYVQLPGQGPGGFNSKVGLTVSEVSNSVARVDYQLLELNEYDATANSGRVIECILDYNQVHHGGFGFHNVKVKNVSNITVPNWTAHIDFGEGVHPTAQWTINASATGNGDTGWLLIEGNSSLAPGQTVTFAVGGQYTGGQNVMEVSCF